jgi:hypothetical protein
MHHRATSALLALAALSATALFAQAPTASAPANILSSEELAQGFKLLFDGSSTNGWRGYRKPVMDSGWGVRDGNLTVTGRAGDIVTVDQYTNFDLRLQWKVPEGGNSGVMFHVGEGFDYCWLTGPEMSILDDARHPDGRSRLTSAGSAHSVYASPSGVVRPANEWNDAELIVRGNHVEHWLNGVKVVEYELHSADWQQRVQASKWAQWPSYASLTTGYIALQGDHGPGVQFRSIRIKVLP